MKSFRSFLRTQYNLTGDELLAVHEILLTKIDEDQEYSEYELYDVVDEILNNMEL